MDSGLCSVRYSEVIEGCIKGGKVALEHDVVMEAVDSSDVGDG